MSRSRLQSGHPPIWAIPVSSETVALWCELPSTSSDVAIVLDGLSSELRFKRRLIARGRRLHLFVLRASDLKASQPCSVSYRPERGKPVIRFQAVASLAEWTTSSVTAAMHAIVEGLATRNGEADTRLLARFLSLTSSWSVPCRYHGAEGGWCAAVFEFVPRDFKPITALTVTNGLVTTQRLLPVRHGEQSCALIWQGDSFDRAYLELDGELLELKLGTRAAAAKPLIPWFAELAPDQQDAVLDGMALTSSEQAAIGLERFGEHLSLARDFRVGPRRFVVSAVFGLGSQLCLVVSDSGDRDLPLRLSLRQRDRTYEARQSLSAEADQARSAVYRTDVDFDLGDGSPIRVTVGSPDIAASHWMAVQGMENSLARRRIRNLINWESVDEDFVRDFAFAAVGIDAAPQTSPLTGIALSTGESSAEAALFICRYSGDVVGLRSTLIALRLTAGDEVAVRLVCRGRLTSREILDLRALCQSLGLTVSLVLLNDATPFSDALRAGPGDLGRRAVILADNGVVPLDREWWQRLAGILDRDPTLLCYGVPEGQPTIEPSALSYLSGSSPLLAAGPRLATGVLDPDFDLQTFEGTIHHALARAERACSAERLGWLRLMATPTSATGASFGPARLDDAMVAAAVGRLTTGVAAQRSNLVRLAAPRAGAG